MEILHNLNSIGGILGPIGFLTAAVFGTLYGKNKATISALEDSNNAYAGVVTTRNLQYEESQKLITTLSQKSEILENQITQAPSINKLIVQIATQHKEMITQMASMTQELGNIAKAMPTQKRGEK